jgi:DNA-binding NtrC family response regulator
MRLYASREFVSRSDTMRRIFEALPELAASDAPLLIVGGCGSGRSALGETIHGLGPGRDGKPLLRLTCPSPDSPKRLVDILTDQHLSDHGGTLLLEELCGARLALQQRLLAWIEDGTPGALRLISTATERLETCLKKGAFRRDLFHRLNVLHVEVPTLRERPEDIPLLVEQLLEGLNQKRGRQIQGVTPAAAARLQQADYPGNVRQLRMVLDEAHRKCRSSFIDVEDLPDLALVCPTCNDATAQQAVLDALDRAGGNLTHAARELGIHRTTLWRKLKRLEQAGGSEDPDAENH